LVWINLAQWRIVVKTVMNFQTGGFWRRAQFHGVSYHIENLYRTWNIYEIASSLDSDLYRYVFIIKSLDSTFNRRMITEITIQEISLKVQALSAQGCLLKMRRNLSGVANKQY
jgi:hypothetical protein